MLRRGGEIVVAPASRLPAGASETWRESSLERTPAMTFDQCELRTGAARLSLDRAAALDGRFEIVSSAALVGGDYATQPIIQDALFAGQPAVLGAPLKRCKTLLADVGRPRGALGPLRPGRFRGEGEPRRPAVGAERPRRRGGPCAGLRGARAGARQGCARCARARCPEGFGGPPARTLPESQRSLDSSLLRKPRLRFGLQ